MGRGACPDLPALSGFLTAFLRDQRLEFITRLRADAVVLVHRKVFDRIMYREWSTATYRVPFGLCGLNGYSRWQQAGRFHHKSSWVIATPCGSRPCPYPFLVFGGTATLACKSGF